VADEGANKTAYRVRRINALESNGYVQGEGRRKRQSEGKEGQGKR